MQGISRSGGFMLLPPMLKRTGYCLLYLLSGSNSSIPKLSSYALHLHLYRTLQSLRDDLLSFGLTTLSLVRCSLKPVCCWGAVELVDILLSKPFPEQKRKCVWKSCVLSPGKSLFRRFNILLGKVKRSAHERFQGNSQLSVQSFASETLRLICRQPI